MSGLRNDPTRILYQFTTTKEKTDLGAKEVQRRHRFLQERAGADVEIAVASPKNGPGSIESAYDSYMAVPEVLESVAEAEKNGYHAVVISCFGDPGLDAARELVSIPVVGSGETSMHVAAQLGTRFSIISPGEGDTGRYTVRTRMLGLESKFVSARGIGLSVLGLAGNREATLERAAEAGRLAVGDGADVLVLGCMSMAFHDFALDLQQRIGVPVVNPAITGIKTAEMMAALGVGNSKVAYPMPPRLRSVDQRVA